MNRKVRSNRRLFLARAAGGTAGLLILPSARMACAYPANERLRLAVFGALGNDHNPDDVPVDVGIIVEHIQPDVPPDRACVVVHRAWLMVLREAGEHCYQ